MTEHAIEIDRYGGPEELVWRAVSRPAPGPREVRIRTLYAAVNRADIEIRRGEWPVMQDDPFPYTPGLEVVGEVDSVGAAVSGVAAGDRAITMMQHLGGIWGERPGGYGEFVVVDADAIAVVPPDVDLEQMAALGLVAVTAAEGLERLGVGAPPAAAPGAEAAAASGGAAGGRRVVEHDASGGAAERAAGGLRVVVHGASGGVGSAAVTMAAAAGCDVIAVLPRAGKEDFVRGIGAASVVRLDETSLREALGARTVDAVLETTGERTFADSVAVLRRGGRLCLVGALTGADLRLSAWDLIQELELTGWSSENLTGAGLRAHVARIAGLVRDGRLRAPAIHRFALAEAAAAHAAIERGEIAGRALLCA